MGDATSEVLGFKSIGEALAWGEATSEALEWGKEEEGGGRRRKGRGRRDHFI